MGSSFSIFKIITEGKAANRFLAASLLSFSFSIAVILSTIGLMDGFENTLKTSLQKSSGDFQLTSEKGFFLKGELDNALAGFVSSPIMQVEAFAVANGQNKGVLVKGIENDSFKEVTSLDIASLKNGVAIGKELSSALGVGIGDEILLTFASDQMRDQGGAILKKYPVEAVITHGIFEKDLRFVYMDLGALTEAFGYREGAINKVIGLHNPQLGVDGSLIAIKSKLGRKFYVEPFWAEYKTLLKAVEVEKASISLVLQVIVIVAIFNVVAFIIFISEKKSQEFFLLRAFGVSMKKITRFWRGLLFAMWFVSAILSVGFTWVFNILLGKLPIFELPGDIYVLSHLSIELGWEDFALVFSLALGWVLLIGTLTMWRMRQRTVLTGLRQEFK